MNQSQKDISQFCTDLHEQTNGKLMHACYANNTNNRLII